MDRQPPEPARRSTSASRDWIRERVSALLLIPLAAWAVSFMVRLPATAPAELLKWMRDPTHTLPLFFFVIVSAYHADLGLTAVMDDYVHAPALKRFGLMAIRLLLVGLVAASAIALFLLSQGH